MAAPSYPELTEEDWLRRMAELRQEVALPGYWSALARDCEQWAHEISVGPFWTEANRRLDQWRMEYRTKTGAALLPQQGLPVFESKSEQSIRAKLYRRSKQQPDYWDTVFGTEGPPLPCLGDLVRTRVACRYIDGVEFLASKLTSLAEEMSLSPKRQREGRIEGYFAQHIAVRQEVIYRLAGTRQLTHIVCEIQIASEMATRMWDASHVLYESFLAAPRPQDGSSQATTQNAE